MHWLECFKKLDLPNSQTKKYIKYLILEKIRPKENNSMKIMELL